MAAVRHLTRGEFAERMGISPETERQWRRHGRVPRYIREGSRTKATIRYPLAEVEAWEQTRLATAAAP